MKGQIYYNQKRERFYIYIPRVFVATQNVGECSWNIHINPKTLEELAYLIKNHDLLQKYIDNKRLEKVEEFEADNRSIKEFIKNCFKNQYSDDVDQCFYDIYDKRKTINKNYPNKKKKKSSNWWKQGEKPYGDAG